MADEASIIFPEPRTVVIGEGPEAEIYQVTKFKLGKTIIFTKELTAALEDKDVVDIFTGNANIVEKLPMLMQTSLPRVVRLLAIILLDNKELRTAQEDGTLSAKLDVLSEKLMDDADLDTAISILDAGVEQVGIENLRKNVTSLAEKFQSLRSSKKTEA